MKRLIAGIAALGAAIAVAPSAANAQDGATVTLLHGIPGVTVDLAVGGAVVIPGFEPGATQDISAFAGQTLADLEVRAAGTTDVVIGPIEALDVPASGNWTVMAHLDADGNPTVTPWENDTAGAPEGQGKVTIRHTAAAPAVDVLVGGAAVVSGAANGDEAVLTLPAGEIAGAQIAPAGGDPIADVPTVNLEAGTNLIVYAVGSLEDETFTFYTQVVPLAAAEAGDEAEAEAEAEVAAEEEGEIEVEPGDGEVGDAEGDGTAAPTQVNTGDEASSSSNTALYAAAAGLILLGGGALVMRRRSDV